MDADDVRYLESFDLVFRDFYVRDLVHADAGDVRMGTFILCAAFIDALALAYSAGLKVRGGKASKWSLFMRDYLAETYEPIWSSYDTFGNRLLHNFSVRGIAFIHGAEHAPLHLQRLSNGDVVRSLFRAPPSQASRRGFDRSRRKGQTPGRQLKRQAKGAI